MNIGDSYLTYQLIKRLATPIKSWPAYKAGVINGDGEILIPKSQMTPAQLSTFGNFDALCLKIKKNLPTLALGSVAVAAYLSKESEGEEMVSDAIGSVLFEELLVDDAPTNSAGSGQVAGMGVPADSLPAATPKKKSRKRSIWDVNTRR